MSDRDFDCCLDGEHDEPLSPAELAEARADADADRGHDERGE